MRGIREKERNVLKKILGRKQNGNGWKKGVIRIRGAKWKKFI